jgi:hypothetical protein
MLVLSLPKHRGSAPVPPPTTKKLWFFHVGFGRIPFLKNNDFLGFPDFSGRGSHTKSVLARPDKKTGLESPVVPLVKGDGSGYVCG